MNKEEYHDCMNKRYKSFSCIFEIFDNYKKPVNEKMARYDSQTYAYIKYKDENRAVLAYFDVIENNNDIVLSNIVIMDNKEDSCANKVEVHYVFFAYSLYLEKLNIQDSPDYENFPFKVVYTSGDKYKYKYYKDLENIINKEIEKILRTTIQK